MKEKTVVFRTVWKKVNQCSFPKEIFWLCGAPGAGKGTHTPFILECLRHPHGPIVVSDLLKSPEAKVQMDRGQLVGDKEVIELVFQELGRSIYAQGVLVDGFPRSQVQVEYWKLLYRELVDTGRTKFHVIVLFVEEEESVARQLQRGREMLEKRANVRKTDLSEEAARERYRVFERYTYEPLKGLKGLCPYYFIDALGSIEEVQRRIVRALKGK